MLGCVIVYYSGCQTFVLRTLLHLKIIETPKSLCLYGFYLLISAVLAIKIEKKYVFIKTILNALPVNIYNSLCKITIFSKQNLVRRVVLFYIFATLA